MIRQALALLASIAAAPPAMARIVADTPPALTYAGIRTDARERPCPGESGVEWPAVRRSGRIGPALNRSSIARLSPSYCVRIGRDGRVQSLYLSLSSGDAALDRALSRDIGRLRFQAGQYNRRPVTAWHRVVVMLDTLPEGLTGTVHRGPELFLVRARR